MKKTIFITGATGFVGSYLAQHFLKNGDTVIALVRKSKLDSLLRLKQAISDVEPDLTLNFDHLIPFEGEIQSLDEVQLAKLKTYGIGEVWHCSASFKFKEKDLEEIKSVNILGTKKLLKLAVELDAVKPVSFFYVSTAYSCGLEKENVEEAFYRHKNGFRSYYEWSKHEAEAIVAEYNVRYGLNSFIFRPSIIIGGLQSKKLNNAAYYQVFGSIMQMIDKMKVNNSDPLAINIIGNPEVKLNMVTIDFVIAAMLKIASSVKLNKNRRLKIFNLINEIPPSLLTVNESLSHSAGYTCLKFVQDQNNMSSTERLLTKSIAFQLPYMNDEVYFKTSKFREIVSELDLPKINMDVEFLNTVNANFLRITKELAG